MTALCPVERWWLPLSAWPLHWRNGRRNGFPACCVVRWLVGPHGRQAAERGRRFAADGTPFVPCGVLHRSDA